MAGTPAGQYCLWFGVNGNLFFFRNSSKTAEKEIK